MAVSGLGVAYAASGFVLLWSGWKNATIKDTLTSFLKGQQPAAHPTGSLQVGVGTGQDTAAAAPQAPVPGSTARGGAPAANRALGQAMAVTYGWAAGQQWQALDDLVTAESGWDSKAQNPSSTAFGLFQFLDTTWASTGYVKTSDPVTQIAAGLKYIRQRYGNPVAAWAFHVANGWY